MNRKSLRLANRAKSSAGNRERIDELYDAVGLVAKSIGESFWCVKIERNTYEHNYLNGMQISGYIHTLMWCHGNSINEVVNKLEQLKNGTVQPAQTVPITNVPPYDNDDMPL